MDRIDLMNQIAIVAREEAYQTYKGKTIKSSIKRQVTAINKILKAVDPSFEKTSEIEVRDLISYG